MCSIIVFNVKNKNKVNISQETNFIVMQQYYTEKFVQKHLNNLFLQCYLNCICKYNVNLH